MNQPAPFFSKGVIALLAAAAICGVTIFLFITSSEEKISSNKRSPQAFQPAQVSTSSGAVHEPQRDVRPSLNSSAAQAATPLLANTWTWQFEGVEPRTLKFLADGTLLQTRFTGTYEALENGRVLVRQSPDKQPAVLTFRNDWSGFDGVDFDGKRAIHGERVPAASHFSAPWQLAPPAREQAFEAILCGTEWTWERLGAEVQSVRFNADRTFGHPNFDAKWAMTREDVIVLTLSGGQVAVIALDPNLAGWQGIDFDGKRPIWGRARGVPRASEPAATSDAAVRGPATKRQP